MTAAAKESSSKAGTHQLTASILELLNVLSSSEDQTPNCSFMAEPVLPKTPESLKALQPTDELPLASFWF